MKFAIGFMIGVAVALGYGIGKILDRINALKTDISVLDQKATIKMRPHHQLPVTSQSSGKVDGFIELYGTAIDEAGLINKAIREKYREK